MQQLLALKPYNHYSPDAVKTAHAVSPYSLTYALSHTVRDAWRSTLRCSPKTFFYQCVTKIGGIPDKSILILTSSSFMAWPEVATRQFNYSTSMHQEVCRSYRILRACSPSRQVHSSLSLHTRR